MTNNKGFTLVELLATIAILSVIMAIAIPNVMSIMEKTKNTTYVEDAKKLVALAEYEFNRNTSIINLPCKMSLRDLDQTDLSTGPNDGTYNLDNSYVVINKSGSKYTFRVQLVENYNGKTKGIAEIYYDNLNEDDAMKKYVKEGITTTSSSPKCIVN